MLNRVHRVASWSAAALSVAVAFGSLRATEPLPAAEVARRVDAAIETQLESKGVLPTRVAGDVEFLRRVHLDIAGTLPTAEEAKSFLAGGSVERRAQLVDRLLASERFGVQLGRVWRDWVAPAELPSEGNGGNQPIAATRNLGGWFAQQFNANRPWNQIVESIVNVDGNLKEKPQAIFFSLVGTDTGIPEPAGATRAVSTLFLGVDLQCAQCHDDPYREWKQTDFWGTAAYFRNMQAKFDGRYFASIKESFGKKLEKGAKKTNRGDASPNGSITIPKSSFENAGDVVPARFLFDASASEMEVQATQPLRPLFSDWLTSPSNPFFARAFVNRTWSYFFGRGLVEPIDDMRPENKPSHPEVIDLLTREFVASGFDVKYLVRCLTNTKAYQRTSAALTEAEEAAVDNFGRRRTKLLSADQLYDALRAALADPGLDLRTYDAEKAKKFGESSPVGDPYMEFCRLFETDENDASTFTHGIPQFLALVNHPHVSTGGKVVEKLVKENVAPVAAVEQLYLGTLSRWPREEEIAEAVRYVEASEDRTEAYAGVLWMLLNRSEFILVR